MSTKVKGEAIKEGSVPLSALEKSVLETSSQKLTDEEKKQVLANLGIDEMLLCYGIKWPISNPTNITRVGNPNLHKELPIQSSLRGCVAKQGKVVYYLAENDWTYKEDGVTPSVLDGTDGDVRVDTGSDFYIKFTTDGSYNTVLISTFNLGNGWIKVPRLLIDAYRCTLDQTEGTSYDVMKTRSVVNNTAEFRGGGNRSDRDALSAIETDLGKPRTNVNVTNFRKCAKNAGSWLLNYEIYKYIFYWLPVIEYATFDLQKAVAAPGELGMTGGLGAGVTSVSNNFWGNFTGYYPLTPCGYGNELGNYSGVVSDPIISANTTSGDYTQISSVYVNRWRGFDNPFGDTWTMLDGIVGVPSNFDESDSKNNMIAFYSCRDVEQCETFDGDTAPNSFYTKIGEFTGTEGYVKSLLFGTRGEVLPLTVGGSPNHGDSIYFRSINKNRLVLVGGHANYGSGAGVGFFNANNSASSAYAYFGTRTFNYYEE